MNPVGWDQLAARQAHHKTSPALVVGRRLSRAGPTLRSPVPRDGIHYFAVTAAERRTAKA